MHYVIGDIHNELKKLDSILNQIQISTDDELIVLGDVFDRGGDEADPFGVYCALAGIQGKCTWIRGNHDQWLAEYIHKYFNTTDWKKRIFPMGGYMYNSFELLKNRITEVDMMNIADLILQLPLQKNLEINGKKYLFAHAMTSYPEFTERKDYYLMGTYELDSFFLDGIEGYISFCGHTPTGNVLWKTNKECYLDEYRNSIWKNKKGNVYLMDCGCGFGSGRLACMCIETGQRFYA